MDVVTQTSRLFRPAVGQLGAWLVVETVIKDKSIYK